MNIFASALALLGALTSLLSLPVHSADLVSAWQTAQTRDPGFKAALVQQAIGDAKREQAQSLWRPSVFIGAFGGVASNYSSTREAYFKTPNSTSEEVQFNTMVYLGAAAQASITALKPLIDKRLEASARQLGLTAEIADLAEQIARQHLARSVVERYVDVLTAQESLRLLKAQQEVIGRADRELRKRRALRDVSEIDVQESNQRLSELAAQRVQLETELEIAQLALRDLSGADSVLAPVRFSQTFLTPSALPGMLDQLRIAHPELKAYDLQYQIALHEAQKFHLGVDAARVDLIAQASADVLMGPGRYGSPAGRLGADQRVGVQITVPLSTGGLQVAQQRESLANAEKTLAERERAALTLEQHARAAWHFLARSPENLKALETALNSARQRLLETRKAHAAGARSTLELMAAEAATIDTERQLMLERASQARNWARLQAFVGRLSGQDIETLQAYLHSPQ